MSTFASFLAEGIFHYSAEDYEGSIEIYNALIICLNRRSLQKDNRRAKSTTVGGDVTTEGDHDSAEIKVILFRALSRRSEAYLALSKYKNAYTDVTTALALFPHFDNGDDFTTSESGLLPSEIELVRDLENRVFVGVLGLDNHVHLDSFLRLKATHLLENPQEPVKFYPGLQGVSPNAELQLENTHDDLSVMTLDTCFRSVGSGSTRTIGTKKNTSQRSRLNVIDEETPPAGSPISQQRFTTSHQRCESAVPQLSTAVNSVSTIAASESSASASAITHLKHPSSPLTRVSFITKQISKIINEFSQTDKYEYTTDGPQTKKFEVDAQASTSSSSSFDSLSSHVSDGINATEPSQNSIRAVAPKSKDVCVIDKTLSSLLSSQRSSVTSHQIREHGIHHAAAVPAQDMKSYLNRNAPNLKAVRKFVEMCNTAGNDEEAIDTLKMALIHDNGVKSNGEMAHTQDDMNSTCTDLALFCLTELLILADKNDENKRMMLSDGINEGVANPPEISAFDAIVEAAQTYPSSAKIQQEVCGLLRSLSTKLQKHVTLDSGCNTILEAMKMHVEKDILQVKALGALEILSYHNVGKASLARRGGMCIVADAMLKHTCNPQIQSKGCVILGNLMVVESGKSASPASEKVVDAVLKGMLQHPQSLDVHEAA